MGSSVRCPWHFEFQSYQNHMGSEIFPGKLPAVHSATHGILNFSPIKITWAANFFRVSCTPTLSLILKLPDLRKAVLPVNNVKMPPLPSGSWSKMPRPRAPACLEPPSGLRPTALGPREAPGRQGPSGVAFFPGSLGQRWHFVSLLTGRKIFVPSDRAASFLGCHGIM